MSVGQHGVAVSTPCCAPSYNSHGPALVQSVAPAPSVAPFTGAMAHLAPAAAPPSLGAQGVASVRWPLGHQPQWLSCERSKRFKPNIAERVCAHTCTCAHPVSQAAAASSSTHGQPLGQPLGHQPNIAERVCANAALPRPHSLAHTPSSLVQIGGATTGAALTRRIARAQRLSSGEQTDVRCRYRAHS